MVRLLAIISLCTLCAAVSTFKYVDGLERLPENTQRYGLSLNVRDCDRSVLLVGLISLTLAGLGNI